MDGGRIMVAQYQTVLVPCGTSQEHLPCVIRFFEVATLSEASLAPPSVRWVGNQEVPAALGAAVDRGRSARRS